MSVYGERHSLENRIKTLFEKTAKISDYDLQVELAKYLCILTSGYLEARAKEMVHKYLQNKANPEISNYVLSTIVKDFRNPGKDRILKLVGSFSGEKRKAIEERIDPELFDSATSVVSIRNNIAHGRDSGITYLTIKDYFNRASKLMNQIEDEFLSLKK